MTSPAISSLAPSSSRYPRRAQRVRGRRRASAGRSSCSRTRIGTVFQTSSSVPFGVPPGELRETPDAAVPLEVRGAKVRCGACSWADRGLIHEGGFYPRRTMTATARLAYYASRLPLAEIGATERFPPTPELARQWADRTPPGFMFDVRGWSLLTGAPTMPDSLFEDLRDEVRPETRDKRRLYPSHLSAAALDECWFRFRHALQPLVDAGRLGTIILTYPSWF